MTRPAKSYVNLFSSPPVVIKDTGTAKGRGVYSARAYQSGEVVEESPVILIRTPFDELPKDVKEIVFDWSSLPGFANTSAIALGYGSLYNHDNPANMRHEIGAQYEVIRFIAARDIAAGEELTINYDAVGGGAESEEDKWFERLNIARL